MNRIVFSYIINVLYTALACWTFVEFYSVITELADIIKTRNSHLKYGLMGTIHFIIYWSNYSYNFL